MCAPWADTQVRPYSNLGWARNAWSRILATSSHAQNPPRPR